MKRFFKNPMFTSWIYTGSKIGVLLVLTALIVQRFSVGEIALWYLFTSIQGFAHLFDIGFSTTIIRFSAYSTANEDRAEFQKGFQSLYGSMNTVFAALVILVIIFLAFIGEFSVRKVVDQNNLESGMVAYAVICIFLPINFFLKKNDAFLKGLNKMALFNNWNALLYFITGIATILAILSDLPFYAIILVNQSFNLINSIKNIYLLKRVVGFKLRFMKFSWHKGILEDYWRPTWKSALISFSSNGAVNLINIMIPRFFPVEVVASYLFSMRILQFVSEFSWAPFYAYVPAFIRNFKQGLLSETSKGAYSRLEMSLLLFILGVTGVVFIADYALDLVGAKTEMIPVSLILPILYMMVLERFTAMHSQVIMFSNNIEHYKHYLILSGVFLLLTFILVRFIGLYGIPAAYVVAVFAPMSMIFRRSLELMKTSLSNYSRLYLQKAAGMLLLSTIIMSILIW